MDLETGDSTGQDAATDDVREADIASAYLRLATATTPAARRAALAELQAGVAGRSPDQVRRMERQRGLAGSSR